MPFATAIAIMVAAVLVTHLGLISAIEETISKMLRREVRLPLLNCGRCLTFWTTALYVVTESQHTVLPLWAAVALPAVMAYATSWLELLLGVLDKLYSIIYDALYTDAGRASDALPADRENNPSTDARQHSADAVPEVREQVK